VGSRSRGHCSRRSAAQIAAVALLFVGVAACGSEKTTTVNLSGAGTLSLVLTGGESVLQSVQTEIVNSFSSIANGGSLSIVDGDHHLGSLICQTDISNGGVSYHVALYSDTSIPSTACAQLAHDMGG
jgi:hypothetical protein